MRKERLIKGKVFKNYRTMCKELEIKQTSGRSKKYQIKDLERYCLFHKEGNSIVIDKVYEGPKEKVKRGANNDRYHALLKDIIIGTLINSESNEIECTTMEAFEQFGITNSDYLKTKFDLRKNNNIYIREFYIETYSKFKMALNRALYKLLIEDKITYKKSYKVNIKNGTRFATNYELQMLSSIEHDVMIELGYASTRDFFSTRAWMKYKGEVNARVKETMGLTSYWSVYTIKLKDTTLEVGNVEDLKIELNRRIVEGLVNSAVKRYKKNTLSLGYDENRICSKKEYVLKQKKIIKELISVN